MKRKKRNWMTALLSLALATSATAVVPDELPIYDDIGGEFSAMSTLDREVRLSDYREKVVLIFFGYTSCQDICPATLGHLRSLMAKLGPMADQVQILFVTVDPENDTAEHLKAYLARFDPRFVGMTGSLADVASIARLYLVKHDPSHDTKVTTEHNKAKTYTDESFQYAHSQQIYLVDGKGRTRALFFAGSPLDEMQTAIQSLLD